MVSKHTTVLFDRPTILEGLARLFDFSGSLAMYNTSRSGEEADKKAHSADWHAVAEDMWSAVDKMDAELREQQGKNGVR